MLALILTGCVSHRDLAFAPKPDPNAAIQHVFVATSRQKSTPVQGFSAARATGLGYAAFTVSIPPDHTPGRIEWPGKKPDAAKDFVTVGAEDLSDAARFRAALNGELSRLPKGKRDIVVFVHGYNTSFAEGLYRVAQLSQDLNVGGVKLAYSWPSAGRESGYAYDRDSAVFARDGLQELLEILATSQADNVLLVAHSMGALLTVETLRQISIAGHSNTYSKLSGVVLMSPDIDVDLFKSQLARIRPLPKPFVIFSSRKDRALRVSALITGETQRLGNLRSVDDLKGLGVLVVDLTNFKADGDWLNHSSIATSPNLMAILKSLPDMDKRLAPRVSGATIAFPGFTKLQKDGYWLVPNF